MKGLRRPAKIFRPCGGRRQAASRCATLRHAASRCATLRHAAPRCATLRHAASQTSYSKHFRTSLQSWLKRQTFSFLALGTAHVEVTDILPYSLLQTNFQDTFLSFGFATPRVLNSNSANLPAAQLSPAQLSPAQLCSSQLSSAQPTSAQLSPAQRRSAKFSSAQLISPQLSLAKDCLAMPILLTKHFAGDHFFLLSAS